MIKNVLRDNWNEIPQLLDKIGFANIKMKDTEIRCGKEVGTNPTSILISNDKYLSAIDFSSAVSGDIFTIIEEVKGLSFRETLIIIKSFFDIGSFEKIKKKKDCFDGIFKFLADVSIEKRNEVIPENTLEQFEDIWSIKFAQDNISPKVQKEFQIGYDTETNRITIPHRDEYAQLIGVMGRYNGKGTSNYKYLPIIPFKKGQVLFGYSQNYSSLYNADIIYIGESEKFVLQLATYGIRTAVALGGCNITKDQILLISMLKPKSICFCFDEGLSQEILFKNINKFNENKREKIEVFSTIDSELPFQSKGSPSDYGKKFFVNLKRRKYE